jgi:hypothetical protein
VTVVGVDDLTEEVRRESARVEGKDQFTRGLATLIRLAEDLYMAVVDVEVCPEARREMREDIRVLKDLVDGQ